MAEFDYLRAVCCCCCSFLVCLEGATCAHMQGGQELCLINGCGDARTLNLECLKLFWCHFKRTIRSPINVRMKGVNNRDGEVIAPSTRPAPSKSLANVGTCIQDWTCLIPINQSVFDTYVLRQRVPPASFSTKQDGP